MPLKVVHFYQQGNRGWTETYYAPGSNPQQFASAYATTTNMTSWLNMRASDVFLTEVRVSLIGSPRVTYSTPFQLQSPNAFDIGATFNQDTYGEDALILVRAGNGIPRHIWLRGLPNQYISYDSSGQPTPPAAFLLYIANLGAAIVSNGLQIQNAQIPTPLSGAWINVNFVESGPTGAQPNSSLNFAGTVPITTPYPPLYFQGVPKNSLPGFPRIITPGVYTPGLAPVLSQIFVPYLFRGPTAQVYPPKMKFTPLAYSYATITSIAFETYGIRKTGRPTGLPRGRASVAIKRQ